MNITNETEQMPVASTSQEGGPDPVDGVAFLNELFQDQITPSASTVATPADCQKE
jgi:hypothetical protein